jgi:hypothetical protein
VLAKPREVRLLGHSGDGGCHPSNLFEGLAGSLGSEGARRAVDSRARAPTLALSGR